MAQQEKTRTDVIAPEEVTFAATGARTAGEGRWSDRGMATVEYAMVTVAAAAFAGVLAVLIRSDEVRGLLAGVIQGAFGG
ncbi:DUF4244 domain-containing protein [Demequina capsici]|uniref:DUF4244 domain-containing protein n=1 Tax=Demequina capsici TaxID=3075620 RepID=A0AA96FA21_9MICO|nr:MULTISPECIES: DUF4244 domain-containing protein [unclassified Demequina]WNM24836.1 DUF4244 domain-containing protein [Demequina sp. OYTSA14]WNM27743.1 DUF4244 domain-containing protein [Demequina sp. PMTSA13]